MARRGIGEDGYCTIRFHLECEELTRDWAPDDWECSMPGDTERPPVLTVNFKLDKTDFDLGVKTLNQEVKKAMGWHHYMYWPVGVWAYWKTMWKVSQGKGWSFLPRFIFWKLTGKKT